VSWLTIITNNAEDTLYLAGYSKSCEMFPGVPTTTSRPLPFIARYSLSKNCYIWIETLIDDSNSVQNITALALNYAEDVLAISGNIYPLIKKLFVVFLDS